MHVHPIYVPFVLASTLVLSGTAPPARAGSIHLRKRPESAAGITLVGGPLCSTVVTPTVHQCEDPFYGSLGGRWLMFYDTDYLTLTGKGYFNMRWEWAYFNRINAPTPLVMPTFTNQVGTFLHVGDAEYPANVLGLDAPEEYGQTHAGRVIYTSPGTPEFSYETFPPGTPVPWQNQYYYLDGSITIHQNEGWADYNLGLTPVSYDTVLGDLSAPIYSNALAVRPGISYDPPSSDPVPGAPGQLTAQVKGSEIRLSWSACPGKPGGALVEYTDGAVYADGATLMYKTAASLPGKAHSWTIGRLQPGGTYSIHVKCFNDAGDSPYSNSVAVTLPAAGALPSAWSVADIGINPQAPTSDPSFGYAGTTSYDQGIFQVGGSGNDIWNAYDYFRFVYRSLNGDGTIVAHVADQMYTSQYAKAGVMIRETLDPAASNAYAVVDGINGAGLTVRRAAAGGTASVNQFHDRTWGWLKLQRSGDTFTGWRSPNGKDWTEMGSTAITMANTVYVGLAVTAHQTYGTLPPITPYNDFNGLNMASFDHVSITGGN